MMSRVYPERKQMKKGRNDTEAKTKSSKCRATQNPQERPMIFQNVKIPNWLWSSDSFTVSAQLLRMSADYGSADDANSFCRCMVIGEGIEGDVTSSVRYWRLVSSINMGEVFIAILFGWRNVSNYQQI
jgi:hypothetical protein